MKNINNQAVMSFKYVYISENRYTPFERIGTSIYVPSGFVMLKDPITAETSL